MLRVTLIRHGHAGEAARDADRALTSHGRVIVRDVAAALRERGTRFDVIISSPLVRAVQTAEIIAERLGHDEEVLVDRALVPEGQPSGVVDLLSTTLPDGKVALVGHEPLLSSLATHLLGLRFRGLRKAEAVRIRLPDGLAKPGELRWVLDPKTLSLVRP